MINLVKFSLRRPLAFLGIMSKPKEDTLNKLSWGWGVPSQRNVCFMGINDSHFRRPNLVEHKVLTLTFSKIERGTLLKVSKIYLQSTKYIETLLSFACCLHNKGKQRLFERKQSFYTLCYIYLTLFFSSKLSALSPCFCGISFSQSAEIGK